MSVLNVSGQRAADEVRGLLDEVAWPQLHELLDQAESLLSAGRLDEAARYVRRAEALLEAGKNYPFKYKSKLGPGPRGRTNTKTGYWDCAGKCKTSGSGTTCKCKGKGGEVRTIFTPAGYKKAYQKQYKKWRSSSAGKAANAKNDPKVKAAAAAYAKKYYKQNKAKILAKKKKAKK